MVSVHRPVLTYLVNWQLYTPENGFQGAIERQGSPFLDSAQVFSAIIVRKKNMLEWAPTKTPLHVLSIINWYMNMGTSMIHLRSIKSSLPFSLPSTSLAW